MGQVGAWGVSAAGGEELDGFRRGARSARPEASGGKGSAVRADSPVLVRVLREHIDRFGDGPDGRLFQSPNGAVVGSGTYSRV